MTHEHTPPHTYNILIIDDSLDDLRLLASILVHQSYDVRLFTNGTDAFASIRYTHPDIILLDVMMPDVDGYNICASLKQDANLAHIPVIFISAMDDTASKVRGFSTGAVDFITKPFQAEEVLVRIANQLELYQMRRQLAEQNMQLHHEIAARQKIEDALRESQHFLTLVTQQIPLLMYVYDLDQQRLVYINRQTPTIFDYIPTNVHTSLSETSFVDSAIFPGDVPTVLNHIQHLATAADDVLLECTYRIRYADGSWHWLTHYDMVFAREAGHPKQVIGAALDVTEQKQATQIVQQQQQALTILQERERLSREFHDSLGQVLASISMHAQSVCDFIVTGNMSTALSLVNVIINMTQETQTDIREFIVGTNASRILHEPQTISRGLVAALHEYCTSLQHAYDFTTTLQCAKHLEDLDLAPNTVVQLFRIIQEALTNVRKHANVLTAQVDIEQHDQTLLIRIADAGCGFDPKQCDSSGNNYTAGSCYGLHSMQGRTDEIGGTLTIASVPGHGTTITVDVPLHEEAQTRLHDIRVLLTDDNVLYLQSLSTVLESRNVVVVGTARTGDEAITQTRLLQPNLILMDIDMPGMNGLEATRIIHTEHPDIPIVMLTVAEDDANLFEAIKQGASGYITKDLPVDKLVQLLVGLSCGEAPLSPGFAARILNEFANRYSTITTHELIDLTDRQKEILSMVASGHTYHEVGAMLGYSEPNIRYHMRTIIKKLHLKNRADAIAFAKRQMAHGVWSGLS